MCLRGAVRCGAACASESAHPHTGSGAEPHFIVQDESRAEPNPEPDLPEIAERFCDGGGLRSLSARGVGGGRRLQRRRRDRLHGRGPQPARLGAPCPPARPPGLLPPPPRLRATPADGSCRCLNRGRAGGRRGRRDIAQASAPVGGRTHRTNLPCSSAPRGNASGPPRSRTAVAVAPPPLIARAFFPRGHAHPSARARARFRRPRNAGARSGWIGSRSEVKVLPS